MTQRLQQLLKSLDLQRGMADGTDPDYSKLDDFHYGDVVAIEWQGELEGVVDYGYVLGLPGVEESDANLGGLVHIPHPQNPGGKDAADAEWVTLYELGTNPAIKRVYRTHSMNERQRPGSIIARSAA